MTINLVETSAPVAQSYCPTDSCLIADSRASRLLIPLVDEAIENVLTIFPADLIELDALSHALAAVFVVYLGHLPTISESLESLPDDE